MNDVTLRFLKSLPENSGQIVYLDGKIKCKFMWFYTDDIIDLCPVDDIRIISIPKIGWDRISLSLVEVSKN